MASKKSLKVCPNGHKFYKSTDCPTCPICEAESRPESGFLSRLSGPARRALEHHGILSLEALSKLSEKEVLKLHGMGPASIPALRKALEEAGLRFSS
ncbi:RNA polymerase alpha subunit C-terminal domain-containing protein [Dyadobacter aurulentus]|uniref:RNA polymerase alpha subunit C-terminal domain-containing protein n=1 Tax=Dyadobacter sp. UC 10 TaxID=2605428 RepID=UPI0011F31A67|nr:RNA polymerase alpha subunit C-terminal domain-containing protein [Dyadobacter sp. UC 10]KAA0993817.1 hypothetical protein FXO21_28360 [Dyadobacter sp. UC 10]